MWTCQCGEQIEDQFDACWKCAGKADDVTEKRSAEELVSLECQRCKTHLEYLGKKRFYEGGHLTPILLGELFVNRENFDLYACSRCGHVELFLDGVGDELRPKAKDAI
jgi:hypothetical protein